MRPQVPKDLLTDAAQQLIGITQDLRPTTDRQEVLETVEQALNVLAPGQIHAALVGALVKAADQATWEE